MPVPSICLALFAICSLDLDQSFLLARVPDITPEEYKRRGDAADALFQEMKREVAAVLRPGSAKRGGAA